MRVAIVGSLAVLLLSDATATARAPATALSLARSHEEFATALARALPLRRSGDRVLAGTASLAASSPSIRLADARGRSLTIATTEQGEATIDDRALVFANLAPDTDVIEVLTADGGEELRVLRSERAPTTFRYHVEREGVSALIVDGDQIVARDDRGEVAFAAPLPFALDARGVRRTLSIEIHGDELVAALDARELAFPVVVDPEWKATASMAVARQYGVAVRLTTGKVLVTGGSVTGTTSTSTAELYDEATGTWSNAPAMKAARSHHTATVLDDGKVLIAGGAEGAAPTAEVYDPVANTFTATLAMTGGHRYAAAAAKLGDGRVLVNGGIGPTSSRDDVYNPTTKTWTATGLTDVRRIFHQATALKDGRVIITGGKNMSSTPSVHIKRIDIFDPVINAYLNAGGLGFMREFRGNHTTTLLPDGRVLAAGGNDDTTFKDSAELYDPAGNSWSLTPMAMVGRRATHSAVTLDTGSVLLMGGVNGPGTPLRSCETFDPATSTFKPFASLVSPRVAFAAAVLPSGRVLAAGGTSVDIDSGYLRSAEIVTAFAPGKTCTAATDCISGFCVDGVCCDKACTGQCEACDVAGKVGTCQGVDGDPHGSRPKCDAPAGDACRAKTCDGIKDVNSCAAYVKGVTCKEAACSGEAVVGSSTCDGMGSCVAPAATPCAPYTCSAGACNTTCAQKTDCAGGYFCKSGSCAPEGASCSADGKASIGKDGKTTQCAAFRCGGDGLCVDRCVDSSVCADGFVCDTGSNQCVGAAGDTGEDGGCGCAIPGGHSRDATLGLGLCAALLGLARRRRRR